MSLFIKSVIPSIQQSCKLKLINVKTTLWWQRRRMCENAGGDLIKPPISVFGITGRYATALYSAGHKKSSLEAVEKDLKSLLDAYKENDKLKDFFISPIMKQAHKAEVLKDVASKAGFNETTSNFLEVVALNGRLNILTDIIKLFLLIMAAHNKEVVCEVVTAKPLDEGQMSAVNDVLKKFVPDGTKIQLTNKINESLIGGMLVAIGDKYVDMSISSKINMYTDIIKKNV